MKTVLSPYFSARGGNRPVLIVIHTTVGYYESTIQYFKSNDNRVSAHYVVSLQGDITNMVPEDFASHHAGNVLNPTNSIVKSKGGNPNHYSIGIENADDNNPHGANRTVQIVALAKLVAEIAKRHNIPIDREHICGHKEIFSAKTCPGNINVDTVVEMAKNIAGQNGGNMPDVNYQEYGKSLESMMKRYGKGSVSDFENFLVEHLGTNGQGGHLASEREFVGSIKNALGLPGSANKSTVLSEISSLKNNENPSVPIPGNGNIPVPTPAQLKPNGYQVEITEGNKKTTINYEVKS